MSTIAKKKSTSANAPLLVIGGLFYISLLIVFAWQTWMFVNFLFPSDELLMKVLTIIAFDILALLWACVDLFYSFASRGAKWIVRFAWIITFILSLLASILYLAITSVFRFHLTISPDMVNTGYVISILAITYNILNLMMWFYLEWGAYHPHKDIYAEEDDVPVQVQQASFAQQHVIESPEYQRVVKLGVPEDMSKPPKKA